MLLVQVKIIETIFNNIGHRVMILVIGKSNNIIDYKNLRIIASIRLRKKIQRFVDLYFSQIYIFSADARKKSQTVVVKIQANRYYYYYVHYARALYYTVSYQRTGEKSNHICCGTNLAHYYIYNTHIIYIAVRPRIFF